MNRPRKLFSKCVQSHKLLRGKKKRNHIYETEGKRTEIIFMKLKITLSLSSSISNITFLLEFSAIDMGVVLFVPVSVIC
jgi:hypothetical protein